jgi:hypothetical protein
MNGIYSLVVLGGAGVGVAAFIMVLGLKSKVKDIEKLLKGKKPKEEEGEENA